MKEESKNYGVPWYGEPQDLREVHDIALAQNPFSTIRMLYKCPLFLLLAGLCFYGAKDLAKGQSYEALGQFWGAVVFALQFVAVLFGALSLHNWALSYWNANPFTQWFMLWGTVAVVVYLRMPVAVPPLGLGALQGMTGQLILATIGALVCEVLAILWLVRRRDSERIHRLKQLGQLVGLVSLVVVVAGVLVFGFGLRAGPAAAEGIVSLPEFISADGSVEPTTLSGRGEVLPAPAEPGEPTLNIGAPAQE